MDKIIDESVYKFLENISLKFGIPFVEIYLIHKWGDKIDDRIVETEKDKILVLDKTTGEPYAEITKEWDVKFLKSS